MSELGGVQIGRDMHTYGLRLAVLRRDGTDPWVEGVRFARPGLECLPARPCNDEGWLVRAGAALRGSYDRSQPGLHLGIRGGLGAAFSEEISFAYLFGLGLEWRVLPRVAPYAEVRWEHTTGINLTMLGAGVRVDL